VRADPDGIGTGFLIHRDRKEILTCRHVVGDRKTVELFFPWHCNGKLITNKSEYLAHRDHLRSLGLLVTGKVLKHSTADLALIEAENLPRFTQALPLGKTPPRLGDSVQSLGNRADLDVLWVRAHGSIRQQGPLTDGYLWQGQTLAKDLPALVTDLPIEEGDSGSPVVNASGELVGMLSAIRRQTSRASIGPSLPAIRAFLACPIASEIKAAPPQAHWARSVVWVRPSATRSRLAGVVVDSQKRWILTAASGLGESRDVGVIFPKLDREGQPIGAREQYSDQGELVLSGHWRAGRVLLRDPHRDLALIQLSSLPADRPALPIAKQEPDARSTLELMSHPMGIEFQWLLAQGSWRQRGAVSLQRNESHPPQVNLFQFPGQGNSAGGVIRNSQGEIVGLLAAREGNQMVAYAASVRELHDFLRDAPGRILVGSIQPIWQCLNSPERIRGALYFAQSEIGRCIGKSAEAELDLRKSLDLHPDLIPALARRAWDLSADQPAQAILECDRILARDPDFRSVLRLRARLAERVDRPRDALADLDRLVQDHPDDGESQYHRARLLLKLGQQTQAQSLLVRIWHFDPHLAPQIAELTLEHETLLAERDPKAGKTWLRVLMLGIASRSQPEIRAKLLRLARGSDDDVRTWWESQRKK
jgi:S1-C subfamily serine protease